MTKEFQEKGAQIAAAEQIEKLQFLKQLLVLGDTPLLPYPPETMELIPHPVKVEDLKKEESRARIVRAPDRYKQPLYVLQNIFEGISVGGVTPSWDKKSLVEISPAQELRLEYLWKMRQKQLDMIPRFLVEFCDDAPTAHFGRIEPLSILKSFGIIRDPSRKFASFYFDVVDDKSQRFPCQRTVYFSVRIQKNGMARLSVEIITEQNEYRTLILKELTQIFPNLLQSFEQLVKFTFLSEKQSDVKVTHRLITV